MKLLLRILACAVLAAACIAFASCGASNTDNETASIAPHYHGGTEYADKDYSKDKIQIEYNDKEAMTAFAADVSKGKYDNEVVTIEGTNTLYGESCGILQDKEDGNYVGLMYYLIDSTFPTDYPKKGDHIKLTGLVVFDKDKGSRHLEVPKDKIEIL